MARDEQCVYNQFHERATAQFCRENEEGCTLYDSNRRAQPSREGMYVYET